jgi:hypothetical protein
VAPDETRKSYTSIERKQPTDYAGSIGQMRLHNISIYGRRRGIKIHEDRTKATYGLCRKRRLDETVQELDLQAAKRYQNTRGLNKGNLQIMQEASAR